MAAGDLGAPHPEGPILRGRDMTLFDDVVEARPTRPRLELRPRVEERLAANDAAIRSLTVVIPVRPGKGRLGARFLGHGVLDRTELGAKVLALYVARHFDQPS